MTLVPSTGYGRLPPGNLGELYIKRRNADPNISVAAAKPLIDAALACNKAVAAQ